MPFAGGGRGRSRWRPPASLAPRATAITPSSAASGTASAMKSEEVKLPSASRAPANPTISTATTTSPHPCRKSRSVNGGAGSAHLGHGGDGLRRAAFGQALAYPRDDGQVAGLVGDQQQVVGMSRVGRVRDRSSADRPRHHLVRARRLDAVPGLLAGDHLVRSRDDLRRHLLRPRGRLLLARGSLDLRRGVLTATASLAAGLVSLVIGNWRLASNSASRIWRTFTLQAMATTTAASPAAPSPSQAATAGWLAPCC